MSDSDGVLRRVLNILAPLVILLATAWALLSALMFYAAYVKGVLLDAPLIQTLEPVVAWTGMFALAFLAPTIGLFLWQAGRRDGNWPPWWVWGVFGALVLSCPLYIWGELIMRKPEPLSLNLWSIARLAHEAAPRIAVAGIAILAVAFALKTAEASDQMRETE